MDKLERSIRKNLAPYGPAIRAGHYGVQHYTVGDMPKRGFIKRVSCDYSDGVVTDIRIYTVGAAMTPHDYYRESYDITKAVEQYITHHRDWTQLIYDIKNTIV